MTNKKSDQSLLGFQTGISVAACTSLEMEQLKSHMRIAIVYTVTYLQDSNGRLSSFRHVWITCKYLWHSEQDVSKWVGNAVHNLAFLFNSASGNSVKSGLFSYLSLTTEFCKNEATAFVWLVTVFNICERWQSQNWLLSNVQRSPAPDSMAKKPSFDIQCESQQGVRKSGGDGSGSTADSKEKGGCVVNNSKVLQSAHWHHLYCLCRLVLFHSLSFNGKTMLAVDLRLICLRFISSA